MSLTFSRTEPRSGLHRSIVGGATAGTLAVLAFFGASTPALADTGNESISVSASSVERGDWAWFDLTGFESGETVVVELESVSGAFVGDAEFEIGSDGKIVNADGQTYQRIQVPRTQTLGSYDFAVYYDGDDDPVVTSSSFSVVAATNKVSNPGDHTEGVEDTAVQQGGVWTFNAKAFAANGQLRATAAGVSGYLGGVGQTVVTPDDTTTTANEYDGYWPLNGYGDTTGVVRVKIPATVSTGSLAVTFSDGTTSITRTLTIDAPAAATVSLSSTTATVGGTITVTGAGWTHPTSSAQGSRIAVKIDEGAYSHITTDLHANKTIWAIIDANVDGTFTATIQLPDGTTTNTTTGSTPAFTAGTHTLRFLSGSLLTGDTSRTVASATFTVS